MSFKRGGESGLNNVSFYSQGNDDFQEEEGVYGRQQASSQQRPVVPMGSGPILPMFVPMIMKQQAEENEVYHKMKRQIQQGKFNPAAGPSPSSFDTRGAATGRGKNGRRMKGGRRGSGGGGNHDDEFYLTVPASIANTIMQLRGQQQTMPSLEVNSDSDSKRTSNSMTALLPTISSRPQQVAPSGLGGGKISAATLKRKKQLELQKKRTEGLPTGLPPQPPPPQKLNAGGAGAASPEYRGTGSTLEQIKDYQRSTTPLDNVFLPRVGSGNKRFHNKFMYFHRRDLHVVDPDY